MGTPSTDTISGVRNEKARKYLMDMRKKRPVPFAEKFPNTDPTALKLLQRLLAFDPKDRPCAEEALADPYFKGLSKIEREPSCKPISKLEFEFEKRRVTNEDIRELIFREILEYHPQLLKDYIARNGGTSFLYPSAIGHFKKQFAYLEENAGKSGPVLPPDRKHVSLPRSTVNASTIPPKAPGYGSAFDNRKASTIPVSGNIRPPWVPNANPQIVGPVLPYERVYVQNPTVHGVQCFLRPNSGRSQMEAASSHQNHHHPPPQYYAVTPNNATSAADMNSNPYYQSHSKTGIMNSQIQFVQNQFAASTREVGAVQLGLT